MRLRHLIAAIFLLLELPVVLPLAAGALVCGLLYGLTRSVEHARALLRGRRGAARRLRLAAGVRPLAMR